MVYSSPHKKRPLPGEPAPWGGCFEETDYPRGAIKRVMMENFMTYTKAMVYPGPRLNLVLGPNGSGKSSIVCAVGLALCATSKRLGRADNVKEFVRKGTDKAHLELIISGGPDSSDYRITRTLHSEGNKSTFKINGQAKSQKDVEALNKTLNIQLDNLCQFLPQEKVVEFSKMSPEELLVNTERAIGDAHLAEMHTKLINGGRELREKQTTKENTDRQLAKKVLECEQMRSDVEKIKNHDRLAREAQRLRARVAQLRERRAHAVYKERKKTYTEAKAAVAKLQKKLDLAAKPRKQKQAELKQFKTQDDGLKTQIKQMHQYLQKYLDESDDCEEQVKDLNGKIEACYKEEAERKAALEASRQQHRTALDELDALPEHPEGFDVAEERQLQHGRNAVNEALGHTAVERGNIHNDMHMHEPNRGHLARKLEQLHQIAYRRLQMLDTRNRGLLKFARHVDEMKRRGVFKGVVHGPIGTEVRMLPDVPRYAAAALENCIPRRVWSAFVVEHPEDQACLRDEARSMGLGRIANVIAFSGNSLAPLRRPCGTQEMHGHSGTIGSLDSTFECPAIVKHVLAEESAVTVSFLVANDDDADRVFDVTPIRQVFGPLRAHRKTVSRYNSAGVSMSSHLVPRPQLLGESVDEAQVQQLQKELELLDEKQSAFEARLQQLDLEDQQAHARRAAVEKRMHEIQAIKAAHGKARRKVKQKIATLEAKITKLEKQDPLLRKPRLEAELQKLRAVIMDKLRTMVSKEMVQLLGTSKKRASAIARIAELQDQLQMLEQSTTEDQESLDERRAQIDLLLRDAEQAQVTLRALRHQWEALRQALKDGDEEKLAELPEDEGECDEMADEREDTANKMAVGDRGVIARYHTLTKAIEDQQAQQAQQAAALQKLQGELDSARANWLPALKETVAKVSAAFSMNFSRIGSVGAIELHEEGDDYEKYSVKIMVKFRDEGNLEQLSAERHSGGEKSVSTIMFLLSLQRITDTPFRVVDEINQGMDQTNERIVFQAMVDAATERGTAQCLLMTPKLLPQLNYSEHVNVLSIVNGAYIGGAVRTLVPSEQLTQLLGSQVASQSQHAPRPASVKRLRLAP